MIRPGWAILAGLVGGLAFLVVIWDAILGGYFEVSFLSTLGASIVHGASRRATYWIGTAAHIALSGAFGLAYAWMMDLAGVSSVATGMSIGLLIGLVHGGVVTVLATSVLADVRPSFPDGGAGKEHAVGDHPRTAVAAWLISHALFGAVVGGVYQAAIR